MFRYAAAGALRSTCLGQVRCGEVVQSKLKEAREARVWRRLHVGAAVPAKHQPKHVVPGVDLERHCPDWQGRPDININMRLPRNTIAPPFIKRARQGNRPHSMAAALECCWWQALHQQQQQTARTACPTAQGREDVIVMETTIEHGEDFHTEDAFVPHGHGQLDRTPPCWPGVHCAITPSLARESSFAPVNSRMAAAARVCAASLLPCVARKVVAPASSCIAS
jgi:hypothetical protein